MVSFTIFLVIVIITPFDVQLVGQSVHLAPQRLELVFAALVPAKGVL